MSRINGFWPVLPVSSTIVKIIPATAMAEPGRHDNDRLSCSGVFACPADNRRHQGTGVIQLHFPGPGLMVSIRMRTGIPAIIPLRKSLNFRESVILLTPWQET